MARIVMDHIPERAIDLILNHAAMPGGTIFVFKDAECVTRPTYKDLECLQKKSITII